MNDYNIHGHANINTPSPMAEISGDFMTNVSYGKHLAESGKMFYGDTQKSPTSEDSYSYITTKIDPEPHSQSVSVNVAYQQPSMTKEKCSYAPPNDPSSPKSQNSTDNRVYQDPSLITDNCSYTKTDNQGSSESDSLMDNLAYQHSSTDDHNYSCISSDCVPTSVDIHSQDPQYEPVEVAISNN